MNHLDRLNNVYVIDTNMFGHHHYHSAYIVKGKEVALIDTGQPNQFEVVRAGIKAHGFSISDISYIFVNHCEHTDHAGNVARILRESPGASIYTNPVGLEALIDPASERALKKVQVKPEIYNKGGDPEPVPPDRIKFMNDGDEFDLGNSEKLKVFFTPGHQASGISIFEEKNKGLFIGDLVGNCFADSGAHYPLNPYRSDNVQIIESLNRMMKLPVDNLFLGHYGIRQDPKQVMARALDKIQKLLDMGKKCMAEGRPEDIAGKMYEMILPELEKFRLAGREEVYQYATQYHIPMQARFFAQYCQEKF